MGSDDSYRNNIEVAYGQVATIRKVPIRGFCAPFILGPQLFLSLSESLLCWWCDGGAG